MTGTDTPSTAASADASPGTAKASTRERAWLGGTLAVLSILILWGLPSYGIWDPWELGTADDARHLLEGEHVDTVRGPLGAWLVARSFGLFDVHEWSGRLPIALSAILLLGVAAGLGHLYRDLRRGTYLAIALATTPLFLLNARHMMGLAPGFLASGLVFACASLLAFPPRAASSMAWRGGLGVGLVLSIGLATLANGVLLGVAPALVAVAAAVVARLPWDEAPLALPAEPSARTERLIQWAIVAVAAVVAIGTLLAVMANAEGYSAWTGGVPRGQTPPTFELPIEALFHSFAPWSAVLPLAAGYVMTHGSIRVSAGRAEESDAGAIRGVDLAALAWSGLALGAQSVHSARYGDGAFVAVLGLAWMVTSFLRHAEETSRGESWARGLVALLLILLLVRDFRGYPGSPVDGLSLRSFTMPEVFNPSGGWAATLGLFGLAAFFGLASDVTARPVSYVSAMGASSLGGAILRASVPIELLRAQWARGLGYRAWLLVGALVVALFVGFGVVAVVIELGMHGTDDESILAVTGSAIRTTLIVSGVATAIFAGAGGFLRRRPAIPETPGRARARGVVLALGALSLGVLLGAGIFSGIGANSLAVRVGEVLLAVPFGVVILIGLGRTAYHLMTSLRSASLLPMLVSAVLLAAWFVVRFHPQASAHFSPREVYDTYNALAADDEPLGEYQVGGRAAAYYAEGEVEELRGEGDVLAFLARPTRVWLALPAEQLAQLDRSYRQRANRHLFVADARNARVLLATNSPIEGRADENYLAGFVLDAPPAIQHMVNASYDRRIELVGYDLELPGGDTVGPGQSFAVTWYWRCVTPVPGGYQPFLHVDGFGQRLNGDHEPVNGRYPVRMWSEGDIVVDRQELRVPANFPPGDYTFFIGFYSGESRLEVVEGPKDDANRVAAGRLRVR
ncbi:MAG: glycosyltransferase family 39 protein [Sandaracinaceae bacterium]|nr:glycosyltransferase family 39 protein [Sandaracinaceae bacterium]